MKTAIRGIAVVCIMALTMSTVACSWAEFANEVNLLVPAVLNVLKFVALAKGTAYDQNLAAKITADAAALVKVGNDFHQASTSAQPGFVPQLNAAWATFSADIDQVFAVANVGGAEQAKIDEFVALAGVTIPIIEALIPASASKSATVAKAAELGKNVPAPKSRREFVVRYNSIMDIQTENKALDEASSRLHIHEHSKVVRVLTFGIAK